MPQQAVIPPARVKTRCRVDACCVPPTKSLKLPFFVVNIIVAAILFIFFVVSSLDLALAETVEQRRALVEFYQSTNDGTGWDSACSTGGWLTLGGSSSSVNRTFCNDDFPTYSTFYGITCDEMAGNVVDMDFSSCNLQGTLPSSLAAFASLEILDLSRNKLRGTLPSEWAAMISIQELNLYDNQLIGTLPPSWNAMTELTTVFLGDNRLSGTLPPEWSFLSNLEFVDLSLNNLIGTLPKEWPERMQKIQSLGPCNATCRGVVGINGTCDATMPSSSSCVAVQLWYNCLTLALPPVNHSNRWNWNDSTLFFGPQRSDCGTSAFPIETEVLVEFYANTGGPRFWSRECANGGWKSLLASPQPFRGTFCNDGYVWTKAAASQRYSTFAGITCDRQNGHVIGYSNAYECGLFGTLPVRFALLTALQFLHLSYSPYGLRGTLPPEWGTALTQLQRLDLFGNSLNGTLPPQWAGMSSLTSLTVANNEITGTLPPEWGRLARLKELSLDRNQLSGTLPTQWASLSELRLLSLYVNNLTGTLPKEWPASMRKIYNKSSCVLTCGGVVGGSSGNQGWCTFDYEGQNAQPCFYVELSYNCLNVTPSLLPTPNPAYTWNWNSPSNGNVVEFQRSDCPVYVPPHSTTLSNSVNETASQTSTSTRTLLFSLSQTMSATRTTVTSTVDGLITATATHPLQPAPVAHPSYSQETTTDSLLVASLAGPLAGLAMGLSAVSNVQRAMLGMQLVRCGRRRPQEEQADAATSLELPRSHSPLGLVVSGCDGGKEYEMPLSSAHCGAVLGNLALVSFMGFLIMMFVVCQKIRTNNSSFRTVLAAVNLPSRALPFAMVLLQPTLSSSLSLLWHTGDGSTAASNHLGTSVAPSYVVGVLGLAACGGIALFVQRAVAAEIPTVVALYEPHTVLPPDSRHVSSSDVEEVDGVPLSRPLRTEQQQSVFSPNLSTSSSLAGFFFTVWVRYEPVPTLQPPLKKRAREFLNMYGSSLFLKYRSGRWWFFGVAWWGSVAVAILESVHPTSDEGCDAVRAMFLVTCVVLAGCLWILHPFASRLLQWLTLAQEVGSIAMAACVVALSEEGVEVTARVQLASGCMGTFLAIGRTVYARRLLGQQQQQQQQRLVQISTLMNEEYRGENGGGDHRLTGALPAPLSSAVPRTMSVESQDELVYLMYTLTAYPSQCKQQSLARLRQLITFIAAEQQRQNAL